MSEFDLSAVDPGVRKLVKLMRDEGFDTYDSGDGRSKPIDERDHDFPHVFSRVAPVDLAMMADRLVELLRVRAIVPGPRVTDPRVEAIYNPGTGDSVVILLHVSDQMLG